SVRSPRYRAVLRSTPPSRNAGSRASRSSPRVRPAPRSADRRSGRSPRFAGSSVLDLQREPRQPFYDRTVELEPVFRGRVLVERRRGVVTDGGEDLGAGLDEIHVVAVTLFGLIAVGSVVRSLGGDTVLDQSALLALEEVELSSDHVRVATAKERHASSR